MPSSSRPRAKSTNQPQPFNEMLVPALPVAPTMNLSLPANRNLIIAGSVALFCILSGIMAGLAIREVLSEAPIAKPGTVVELSNPTLARITQAKAVAAFGPAQTLQITQTSASLQTTLTSARFQPGSSINDAQFGLSSYYLQGSVGISATK